MIETDIFQNIITRETEAPDITYSSTNWMHPLNHDLFLKHITDSPLCQFGEIEITEHYFLSCRLYHKQRVDLMNIIWRYTPVTLQIVLYGSNMLPLNINNAIFEAVHKYIKESKRF